MYNMPLSCYNIQVPEPIWHVSGRSCGGSGLHGLSVGRREPGHGEELQEEEPLCVCRLCNGHQLLPAVAVWRRPGLHVWHHLPLAV